MANENLNKQGPNLVDAYLSMQKEKENRIKSTIENEEYMKWISNFTVKNVEFWDDSYSILKKSTMEDKKNVSNIQYFYEAIRRYADENFIKFMENDTSFFAEHFYEISYNNELYKIGIIAGQGTSVYCRRIIDVESAGNPINFYDIMHNKTQEHVEEFKQQLEELSDLVRKLCEANIPEIFIEEYFYKGFSNN